MRVIFLLDNSLFVYGLDIDSSSEFLLSNKTSTNGLECGLVYLLNLAALFNIRLKILRSND